MALFEDSIDQLIATMQATVAIDTLTYWRGTDSVILVKKVWTGRTPFRIMDRGQSRLIFGERDFLIPCKDLKLNNILIVPQEGDWIEIPFENLEGNKRFEFMAPNNEPIWRYSDPQRKIYRIHAKQVS